MSKWRSYVCVPMIAILPFSLMAEDTAGAILRSNGGVWINGSSAPATAAIFRDDLIETRDKGARIEASGSTVDVNPETVVQYEIDELVLDHGTLSINTSRGLKVRIGCVTVTPVNSAEWTTFDVADHDGKVIVSALKNDVYIDAKSSRTRQMKRPAESNRVVVHEGERKSREGKCGAGIIAQPADTQAIGPWLDSPWAIGGGIIIVGGITCYALCRSSNPASPSTP